MWMLLVENYTDLNTKRDVHNQQVDGQWAQKIWYRLIQKNSESGPDYKQSNAGGFG